MIQRIYRHILKEKFNGLIWLMGLVAAGLMIYQFLFRKGLWLDELFIGDNLVQRDFWGLLHPLARDQVAPVMFLWVEKALLMTADSLFPNRADHFLRLYPLLCGFGVLALYYKVVFKLTGSRFISLIAYALLVFNPVFIYYTSEVKQYICELFYAILLTYIWLKNSEIGWHVKNTILFLWVVLLAVLNSSTICFILLPMGFYDGWVLFKQHNLALTKVIKSKETLFYIARYFVSFLFLVCYYFCFLYHHPTSKVMHNYWKNSFIKLNNSVTVLDNALSWLYYDMNVLICLIALMTLLTLKKKQAFVFSVFILLGHVIFSCFKLYPVNSRLVFYWLIVLTICIASLIYFMCNKCKEFNNHIWYNKTALVMGGCLIGLFLIPKYNHWPIYLHNRYIKKILAVIEKNYTSKDIVILQRMAYPHEYLDKYYITKIPPDHIINISDADWKIFLKKAVEHIATLQEFEKVWIIPKIWYNSKSEIANNELFHRLPVTLSFCKKIKTQELCLIKNTPK